MGARAAHRQAARAVSLQLMQRWPMYRRMARACSTRWTLDRAGATSLLRPMLEPTSRTRSRRKRPRFPPACFSNFSTFTIDTVPAQLAFLKSKLAEWHFEADDSVDPAVFTDANLARYGAVAMVNTCFEPFGLGKPDRPQSEALQRFVQRGGGSFRQPLRRGDVRQSAATC